jgi:hypothetical protein
MELNKASRSSCMCSTSSVHMSVPDLLKYGTRGGMKWERWRDKVNIERLRDVMMMLMNGGKEATLLRAEFDRLQVWVGSRTRAMGLQSGHNCTATNHTNLWSVGLWQWMVHPPHHELSLETEVPFAKSCRVQEVCRVDPRGLSTDFAQQHGGGEYVWRVS